MERDFDELKIIFARKQGSAIHWQRKTEKAIPVLDVLKAGYVKTVVIFILTAFVIVLVDNLSSARIQTSVGGFRILLICALYYAVNRAYMHYRLSLIKPTLPVLQATEQLERYKKLTTLVLTYGELLYAIALSIGVYLYIQPLMPFLEKENPYLIKGVVVAYSIWVVIYTLVIKRKHLKNELHLLEMYLQALKSEN